MLISLPIWPPRGGNADPLTPGPPSGGRSPRGDLGDDTESDEGAGDGGSSLPYGGGTIVGGG